MSTASVVTFSSGMPDIANHDYERPQGTLDWVGMAGIHQPLRSATPASSPRRRGQVYVDLADPQAKGIHMSRLYLMLERRGEEPLTPAALHALLGEMLGSHGDISTRAFINCASSSYAARR